MLQLGSCVSRSLWPGPVALLGRAFASQPATALHEKPPPLLPPFSYQPQPYTGPSKEEVLSLRKKYLSPCKGLLQHTTNSTRALVLGMAEAAC
jgi:alanine-glyoxylate transaminase/(R)-3-amino-2-methylpropionate-pyruvate transaminase